MRVGEGGVQDEGVEVGFFGLRFREEVAEGVGDGGEDLGGDGGGGGGGGVGFVVGGVFGLDLRGGGGLGGGGGGGWGRWYPEVLAGDEAVADGALDAGAGAGFVVVLLHVGRVDAAEAGLDGLVDEVGGAVFFPGGAVEHGGHLGRVRGVGGGGHGGGVAG